MRQLWIPSLLALLACGACSNTAEGVKEDTSVNSQKAAESAQDISQGAKKAGEAFGAETMLAPKVKLAITADKRLNDPSNLIDVSATTDKVTLSGHVTSSELKQLAGDIASKVLTDSNAKQEVDNELEIQG